MQNQLVTFDFQSHAIPFTQDAHINLTVMCAAFGKSPHHFMQLEATRRFIVALAADTGLSFNSRDSRELDGTLVTTTEGHNGGTWAHPDLALECARWLSPEFAIWTNRTSRKLLSGECLHSAQDVRALARLECRMKEMQEDLRQMRRRMGRMTEVDGNVSLWAYLKAAALKLDKVKAMQAARETRLLCLKEQQPIGTVKQRTNNQSGWNVNKTFPPAMLCHVLNALGLKHTQPPLSTIMKLWAPHLPLSAAFNH